MKILPVEKIREADAYTIKNEPINSIDLMERAATQCYKWIRKKTDNKQPVKIFCGPGNNGGDGLVVARLLTRKNYDVQVFIVRFTEKGSADFNINLKRLKEVESIEISEIRDGDPLPDMAAGDLVIDAIFGSGLSRPVTGFTAQLINLINKCGAITVAIDAPSGLFSDENSTEKKGAIIEADYTLTFQLPKLAFLFPENDKFVGKWTVLPIGLMEDYIDGAEAKNYTISRDEVGQLLKPRNKFAHKGTFGHALLIAGGYGKMGAAVMSAKAALRSGAGLVTAHIPKSGNQVIPTALPECMVSIDDHDEVFTKVPDLGMFNAIGVGPGLGTEKKTQNALKMLIQNAQIPMLFDADAINILGENKTWISFIPKGSIFTPHPKEFERLVNKSIHNFQRHEMQRQFSVKHHAYVVLKGAHTCITTPSGESFFNTTGNPGMATGGSGDVLTGIILGLLAQNYHPKEAAILGVYLHGLAGDIAAKRQSQEALMAGDITENLGKAFRKV